MDKINKDIVSAQLQITRDVMSAWKSQILFSLSSLGVFDALRDKPLRHETLAQILSVPAESLRRLLNAAVAAGYLEKCDGAYTNIEALKPVLCTGNDCSMNRLLSLYRIWYKTFSRLEEAVRTNSAVENANEQRDANYYTTFIEGMTDYAQYRGRDILNYLDLTERTSFLDVGCGPGIYASMICKAYPNLEYTCYDVAPALEIARTNLQREGIRERIHFRIGDYHNDDLFGGPYDVVFLSHVFHQESSDCCLKIAQKAYSSLVSGGIIVVQAMFLNNDETSPLYASFHDLLTLLIFPGGRNYTFQETERILRDAGFDQIQAKRMSLFNVNSLLIGKKGNVSQ